MPGATVAELRGCGERLLPPATRGFLAAGPAESPQERKAGCSCR
jgi:hypothetical protein